MSEFLAWYNKVRAELEAARDTDEVFVSDMWTIGEQALKSRVVWVDSKRRVWRPDRDRNVLTTRKRL